LKCNAIEGATADQEEAGKRVFDTDSRPLKGPSQTRADFREQPTNEIPFAHSSGSCIATGNYQVVASLHCFPEFRQNLRRMLQIGVYHSQDLSLAVPPCISDGSRQPALFLPHQKPDPGILLGDVLDDGFCSVATIIINYNEFIVDIQRVQAAANALEHSLDVFCLVKRRYHDGQLGHWTRGNRRLV